jgi:hypothetical protein
MKDKLMHEDTNCLAALYYTLLLLRCVHSRHHMCILPSCCY